MIQFVPSLRPEAVFPATAIASMRRCLVVVLTALLGLASLTLAVLLLSATPGWAQTAAQNGQAAEAGLFFRTGRPGEVLEAPLLKSDVEIDISGMVARVTVRQHFRNPSLFWLEGVYVFPLPERSAVNRLTMLIGDRRVNGRIMEKEEARKTFEQAATDGKHASLLSAERPNVFASSVANIGPGEEIVVEIGYQDSVAYDAGRFTYRFPMVVAPRFTPPAPALAGGEPTGPTRAGTTQPGLPLGLPKETAGDLFGPVLHPDRGPINPLSLTVDLDAGVPLQDLKTPYHDVIVESLDEDRHRVTLARGTVPANRDFLLEWEPKTAAAPQAAIYGEEIDGASHLMVMLVPPAETPAAHVVPPRDILFIIDTSGSMYGPSLDQAKRALEWSVQRLRPQDRFNIYRFASDFTALFPQAVAASPKNLSRARRYIDGFEADGGTMMRPALEAALREETDATRFRQIVFITDGAVSNEDELFDMIARRIGQARLFTVGIGSAPNSYFMRKAAEMGRGSFTYIGQLGEVDQRMTSLLSKIAQPAVTGITVEWPAGVAAEAFPDPIPDLYHGEPLIFAARLDGVGLTDLKGELTIRGAHSGETWSRQLGLDNLPPAAGTAAIWARHKLETIEDQKYRGTAAESVRAQALKVALKHQLVTRYTSLVAVDDTPVRPTDADLERLKIPRNLPEGWNYDKVFGKTKDLMPARSLPQSLLRRTAAAAPAMEAVALPQGATAAELQALLGVAALLLGNLLLLVMIRLQRGRTSDA